MGAAAVKPARFAYARPATVEEALDLLAEHSPGARPLAGGQSLVPWLNMRRIRVEALVDITRLPGLDAATMADGELRVGALVTQTALEAAAAPLPVVAECLPFTGHLATRNRGTVGGSIAHADPKGELPLALLAAGGSAVVASSRDGDRTLAADALFTGPFQTALAPDELVLETRWPLPVPGEGDAFEELAQRQGDFTLASVACRIRLGDGHVAAARVAAGAVADRPLLVPEAAEALTGLPAGDGEAVGRAAKAAGDAAAAAVPGIDDLHGSAAYRRHLTGALVRRAVTRALRRAAPTTP
jgi:carbon-monoxide dehydrogenase medium subunit